MIEAIKSKIACLGSPPADAVQKVKAIIKIAKCEEDTPPYFFGRPNNAGERRCVYCKSGRIFVSDKECKQPLRTLLKVLKEAYND